MTSFIGEYTCRLDTKGRVLLPSGFKKQLGDGCSGKFIIRKSDFEPCLELFPEQEWERTVQLIREKTNPFNKQHAQLLRAIFRGAAELELDSSSRLLLPRRLLDLAEVTKELVLLGKDDRIEIWNVDAYNRTALSDAAFEQMVEDVLGGSAKNRGDE